MTTIVGGNTNVSWLMRAASFGYETLKPVYECKRMHIPEKITLDFINRMIQMYVEQEAWSEYE